MLNRTMEILPDQAVSNNSLRPGMSEHTQTPFRIS